MSMLRHLFVLPILCAAFASAAHAHHLWVAKTGDTYLVARGMAPERMDPYDPGCVKEIWAVADDGRVLPFESIQRCDAPDQVRFRISEAVSLVGIACDWGYRVNTTRGKKLLTRQEAESAGLRVIDSFFSTQFTKVLFKESPGIEKPIGMKFELLPLEGRLKIPVGDEIPVQALFEGRPLSDIAVFSQDGQEFKTDMQGIARIKTAGKGLQLFMAQYRVPAQNDADKDYHLYTTFLVFESQ